MEEGAHAKIVQCLMSMFKDFKAVQAFVAFSNGSVVIFKSSSESAEDLKKKATRKMAKLGPDFAVENVNVMKVEGLLTAQLFAVVFVSRNLRGTLLNPTHPFRS